jgi:hypothetical protein
MNIQALDPGETIVYKPKTFGETHRFIFYLYFAIVLLFFFLTILHHFPVLGFAILCLLLYLGMGSAYAYQHIVTTKRVVSYYTTVIGEGNMIWSYHKDILDIRAEKTFADRIFNTTTVIFTCAKGPYVNPLIFWQKFPPNLLKSRKVIFSRLINSEDPEKLKEIVLKLKSEQSNIELPEPQVPAFYKVPSARGIFKSILIGIAIFILIIGAIVGIGFLIK